MNTTLQQLINPSSEDIFIGINTDEKLTRIGLSLEAHKIYSFICFCVQFDKMAEYDDELINAYGYYACRASYRRLIESCLRTSYPNGSYDYLKKKVISAVQELIDCCLIEKFSAMDENGGQIENIYKLCPKSQWQTAPATVLMTQQYCNIRGVNGHTLKTKKKDSYSESSIQISKYTHKPLEINQTTMSQFQPDDINFTPDISFSATDNTPPIYLETPSVTNHTPLSDDDTEDEQLNGESSYHDWLSAFKDELSQMLTNGEENSPIIDCESVTVNDDENLTNSVVYNNNSFINNNINNINNKINKIKSNAHTQARTHAEYTNESQKSIEVEEKPRPYKGYLDKSDIHFLTESYNRNKPKHWLSINKLPSHQRRQLESILRENFNPGGVDELVKYITLALEYAKNNGYCMSNTGGLHTLLYKENFITWADNTLDRQQRLSEAQIDTANQTFIDGVYPLPPGYTTEPDNDEPEQQPPVTKEFLMNHPAYLAIKANRANRINERIAIIDERIKQNEIRAEESRKKRTAIMNEILQREIPLRGLPSDYDANRLLWEDNALLAEFLKRTQDL